MSDQLRETCRHFSPAYVCPEKRSWGHCMKRVRAPEPGPDRPTEAVFTWADNCRDDFQPRLPASGR